MNTVNIALPRMIPCSDHQTFTFQLAHNIVNIIFLQLPKSRKDLLKKAKYIPGSVYCKFTKPKFDIK